MDAQPPPRRRRKSRGADANVPQTLSPSPPHIKTSRQHFQDIATSFMCSIAAGVATDYLIPKSNDTIDRATTAFVVAFACIIGLLFSLLYQRYNLVLSAGGRHRDSPARIAYDQLRQRLLTGGRGAAEYTPRLKEFLDAIDHLLGDADKANSTLFPHAFGLTRSAPLWTAPAFDRCLFLALLYPIGTIFFCWVVSGHVGPAESALGLYQNLPLPFRGVIATLVGAILFSGSRYLYKEMTLGTSRFRGSFWLISITVMLGALLSIGLFMTGASGLAGVIGLVTTLVFAEGPLSSLQHASKHDGASSIAVSLGIVFTIFLALGTGGSIPAPSVTTLWILAFALQIIYLVRLLIFGTVPNIYEMATALPFGIVVLSIAASSQLSGVIVTLLLAVATLATWAEEKIFDPENALPPDVYATKFAGFALIGASSGVLTYLHYRGFSTVAYVLQISSVISIAVCGILALIILIFAQANKYNFLLSLLNVFIIGMIAVCLSAANFLSSFSTWPTFGPIILFLGILTLINAPFDWFSVGLTRALLRRGLELQKWWPYALAVLDSFLATIIITILSIVSVVVIQAFNEISSLNGYEILPLDSLFDGITTHPRSPEYWWVYFLLVSSMLPSLINLMIGGICLARGVPWLNSWVIRRIPDGRSVHQIDRRLISLALTGQDFMGAALGIGAQAFFVWIVILKIMPLLRVNLLEMSKAVVSADIPQLLWRVVH
jgi:hypothetical protein